MELFNYLYFTCQKKIKDMNLSVLVPVFSFLKGGFVQHTTALIQGKI